jgi:hypothetical protein
MGIKMELETNVEYSNNINFDKLKFKEAYIDVNEKDKKII